MNMQAVQAQLESSWVGPFNMVQWGLILLFAWGVWMFFGKDIQTRVKVWLGNLKDVLLPADRPVAAGNSSVHVVSFPLSGYGPEALHEAMLNSGIDEALASEFVKANWETILAAKKKREAV